MTTQEASFLLFEWFKDNDYFSIDSDYSKVIKGKNLHKPLALVKCSLQTALEKMEKGDLITGATCNMSEYWILNKKFENMTQELSLSGLTCQAIFKILSDCAENLGVKTKTDPMNITDDDIQTLIWVIGILQEKNLDNGASLN